MDSIGVKVLEKNACRNAKCDGMAGTDTIKKASNEGKFPFNATS